MQWLIQSWGVVKQGVGNTSLQQAKQQQQGAAQST
jgi:hypothetical protein